MGNTSNICFDDNFMNTSFSRIAVIVI